jgi:hypothetical protein
MSSSYLYLIMLSLCCLVDYSLMAQQFAMSRHRTHLGELFCRVVTYVTHGNRSGTRLDIAYASMSFISAPLAQA